MDVMFLNDKKPG